MLTNFVMTFIPLFGAFDPIGVLPIYMSLTEEMEVSARRRILRESIITASVLTILFLLIGKGIFIILGITISDFQIAGGLILSFAGRIISFLGEGGARATSKVVSLFLAAIAVMIIRKGLEGTLSVY